MQIPISDIVVKKRIRKNTGDLEPLMQSLKRYGQLSPITIDSNHVLIAGQRRLESAKRLGWLSIEAVIVDTPSKVQRIEMEIEENTQREPFTDEELMSAYLKLERLRNPPLPVRIGNAIVRLWKKLVSFIRSKLHRQRGKTAL